MATSAQHHIAMNSVKRRKAVYPSHRHHYGQPDVPSSTESDNDTANTDSPLLRLPPELRNRIYALVLGVGHIHVRHRPHGRRLQRPASPTTSAALKPLPKAKENGFYALALPADVDPWGRAFKKKAERMDKASRAAKPSKASSKTSASASGKYGEETLASGFGIGGLGMALLLACRQIHAEAALLPFSLNAWSFESTPVMERYLVCDRRLALAQRRAIRVLVVSDDLPSRRMERYLGGLRVVVWRNESTKTFETWHLPQAMSCTPTKQLLLFDN